MRWHTPTFAKPLRGEAMKLIEIGGIETSTMGDDTTRQSWKFGAVEIEACFEAALSEEKESTIIERDGIEHVVTEEAKYIGIKNFKFYQLTVIE